MAGGRGLGKEVIQGIFGALAMILVSVGIGSLIAQALSPGPEGAEQAVESAEEAPESDAAEEGAPEEEAEATDEGE